MTAHWQTSGAAQAQSRSKTKRRKAAHSKRWRDHRCSPTLAKPMECAAFPRFSFVHPTAPSVQSAKRWREFGHPKF